MSDVKIYCEVCNAPKPATIEMTKDVTFSKQGIWGDILCSDCSFVIATVTGEIEGKYELVLIK